MEFIDCPLVIFLFKGQGQSESLLKTLKTRLAFPGFDLGSNVIKSGKKGYGYSKFEYLLFWEANNTKKGFACLNFFTNGKDGWENVLRLWIWSKSIILRLLIQSSNLQGRGQAASRV